MLPVRERLAARIGPVWCLTGIAGLFGFAIARLSVRGVSEVVGGLAPVEWLGLAVCSVAFVYGEGYRALHAKWVPDVVRRADSLGPDPAPVTVVLAPLYGMGLIGGTARQRFRAWGITGGVILAVSIVSRMPQPWRGIVDLSVAAALALGLVSILSRLPKRLRSSGPVADQQPQFVTTETS